MTRRKALTIAISVAGLSGLLFVLLLMSKPMPASSHASYAWQPGCHCGKPATTVKPTTTTAKAAPQSTTTTARKVTTTATSAARAASATTGTTSIAISTTSVKKSSTSVSTTKSASSTTLRAKRSTTTAGVQNDGSQNGDQNGGLALGAAVASLPGGGDGGSSGGTGDPGGSSGAGSAGSVSVATNSVGLPHYYISPVAIGFLLVYGISFALYRTKRLRVATHRKVWNLLLLATFLLCGIMGLVLAVGVTRNPPMEFPTWLLVWHVETGIAMCFISCFHIGWHLRYYLALVTGRRRTQRAEKVPAIERGAARERARRPRAARPVLVRTEEERMLAFKQRQAARAGEARAAQPASSPTEADRWVEEAKRRVAPAT